MIAMAGRGVVVQPAAPEAARGWAGLGSVSSHLTMHAHCQVEVVRGVDSRHVAWLGKLGHGRSRTVPSRRDPPGVAYAV